MILPSAHLPNQDSNYSNFRHSLFPLKTSTQQIASGPLESFPSSLLTYFLISA